MEVLRKVTALIFPERCPYCGRLIEPCKIACDTCMEELSQKHVPIPGGAGGCRCVSSFVYDGKVRRMILRLKYRDRTQFVPQVAAILADDIRKAFPDIRFDIITAVPMHPKDQRIREYNQSELLAKALGKVLDIPYQNTLQKIKHTKKQHHLKHAERKTNLSGAFALIDREIVKGKRVLIVDDIITSGNTLKACCKTLSRAKPEIICCATIANAREKYLDRTVI